MHLLYNAVRHPLQKRFQIKTKGREILQQAIRMVDSALQGFYNAPQSGNVPWRAFYWGIWACRYSTPNWSRHGWLLTSELSSVLPARLWIMPRVLPADVAAC